MSDTIVLSAPADVKEAAKRLVRMLPDLTFPDESRLELPEVDAGEFESAIASAAGRLFSSRAGVLAKADDDPLDLSAAEVSAALRTTGDALWFSSERAAREVMVAYVRGEISREAAVALMARTVGLDDRFARAAVNRYVDAYSRIQRMHPRWSASTVEASALRAMRTYSEGARLYRAEMILATEANRVASNFAVSSTRQALLLGEIVDARMVWVALPGAESRCRALDGSEVVSANGVVVGETPPLHPWCRCRVEPR